LRRLAQQRDRHAAAASLVRGRRLYLLQSKVRVCPGRQTTIIALLLSTAATAATAIYSDRNHQTMDDE